MRGRVSIAMVVGVFLLAVVHGTATQTRTDGDLTSFRATTPEQKVRAATFDQPTNPPLRPNQTRFETEESASVPHNAPEYESFIREVVCQSDVVVLGTAVSKQSFLTQTDSSIFTDYSVAPEAYIRGAIAFGEPTRDTTITVSLRGGAIQTSQGPIEVKNEQPLNLGERDLLFLKRIGKTSSFELSGPHFSMGGATPRSMSRRELPTTLAKGQKDTTAMLADVRSAASTCQKGSAK